MLVTNFSSVILKPFYTTKVSINIFFVLFIEPILEATFLGLLCTLDVQCPASILRDGLRSNVRGIASETREASLSC